MLLYLIRRDLVVMYKQTVLGPAWIILHPFLMSFLFSIVFGRIAGIPTNGIPGFLFYFANNVFWTYLATSYGELALVFTKGKVLMGKVYFPRLIVPLANLGNGFVKFLIQLLFLLVLYLYYLFQGMEVSPGIGVFWLPVVILQISLTALGAGFIFAWMTLKYRDLSVVSQVFVQGWMYISPVAYPLSEVPQKFHLLCSLNPMTGALEMARHSLYGSELPSCPVLLTGAAMSVLIFLVGLFTFNVSQRRFIDVI